jgi:erythrin-vacuolar iron transport family protein
MSFSEGLSDTGELTGRGNAVARGGITGLGTFIGGLLHTLPFLIPTYSTALIVALIVIGLELVLLAYLRYRFFETGFARSLAAVTLGGVLIAGISAALGSAAG